MILDTQHNMSQYVDIVMARGLNGTGVLKRRQIQVVSVISMLIFLSTLAVALRFISRRMMKRHIYLDDYVIVFALFLSYGNCVCELVGLHYGLGQHASQVGRHDEVKCFILLYISELLSNTILPAIKISILLFYRRLFPLRHLLVASSIIGAIVVAWYIAIQITAIFQCLPIHYFWLRVGRGHCIQTTNFYIALASLNLATDIAVLILPIPFIWQIQIRKSKKLPLSAVFLVGLIVCVTSVIRLQTLTDIDSEDITWSNVYPGLWTVIEASLGIVAACLPSLGPILQMMTGHILSTTNDTTGQSQHVFTHAKLPFRDADIGDFERILDSGPQGRDEAVILNAIVGRSSTDFVTEVAGTSHEMEALRKDGSTARKEDAIVVRSDIEQAVEQRIE